MKSAMEEAVWNEGVWRRWRAVAEDWAERSDGDSDFIEVRTRLRSCFLAAVIETGAAMRSSVEAGEARRRRTPTIGRQRRRILETGAVNEGGREEASAWLRYNSFDGRERGEGGIARPGVGGKSGWVRGARKRGEGGEKRGGGA